MVATTANSASGHRGATRSPSKMPPATSTDSAFKAWFLRTSPPTSADGIDKYLSSGMIRGIGPAYAKKLLRAFGEKVFDVIEATPDRLREVDGIGPVRAASILAAWPSKRRCVKSWSSCTATVWGRRGRRASLRLTVPTPSRS